MATTPLPLSRCERHISIAPKGKLTSHLRADDVWAGLVVEGEAARVGARLHLGLRPGALALAAVVGEGERAAEGAGHGGRAVHAEHGVEGGVARDEPAHLRQARPLGGASES